MSAHDLDDESARVRGGGGGDGIDGVANSVERCSCANGQICACHVVVDAADGCVKTKLDQY